MDPRILLRNLIFRPREHHGEVEWRFAQTRLRASVEEQPWENADDGLFSSRTFGERG
jgi:hypothetical protein